MSGLKSYALIPVVIVLVVVSWVIWDHSPEYIRRGGPLLIVGLTLFFLSLTYSLERYIVLWRAGGRGSVGRFIKNVKENVHGGDVSTAITSCKEQGGCLANTIGAGLERFELERSRGTEPKDRIEETKQAIQTAGALETPLLERNLTALSTIASIATLIGLLGTTIGMIRAFHAMSNAGAPDATQLALGISEALVNTALGLSTAIIATVLYNYFTTRVDEFNNTMEETTYEVLHLLDAGQRGS